MPPSSAFVFCVRSAASAPRYRLNFDMWCLRPNAVASAAAAADARLTAALPPMLRTIRCVDTVNLLMTRYHAASCKWSSVDSPIVAPSKSDTGRPPWVKASTTDHETIYRSRLLIALPDLRPMFHGLITCLSDKPQLACRARRSGPDGRATLRQTCIDPGPAAASLILLSAPTSNRPSALQLEAACKTGTIRRVGHWGPNVPCVARLDSIDDYDICPFSFVFRLCFASSDGRRLHTQRRATESSRPVTGCGCDHAPKLTGSQARR
jgi:hypothetical protein